MTTSNSVDFSLTRNEIIADALISLGVYRPGATISASDTDYCARVLNRLIKSWQLKGIHVWTEEEGALFFTENKNIYNLSASTTDKVGKDSIHTTLDSDATSTSITVVNTIGMSAADNIGVVLDDNTIHWTTIVSVDSTTTLTITAAPASTGSSGNSVYTYTSAVGRPLYIKSARLQDNSGVERPVAVMGRTEFMNLSLKESTGPVTAIFYSPKTDTGKLYTWMTPSDANESLRFSYIRTIQDLDSSSDNPDLPQEWYDCIVLNLMSRIAKGYGKDIKDRRELKEDALQALVDAVSYDIEEGSTYIGPAERFDD